jgi:predicted CoA-substrate-specific enzyme activase
MAFMLVCGCDIGSTTGKALLLDEGGVVGYSIIPCATRPEHTADLAIELALEKAGLGGDEVIDYIVATGYGRVNLQRADENVSEITCHGRGAHHLRPTLRTVIDIGGQDCKVMSLSEEGRVVDFSMNDKCAAGTGRFFEAMSRAIGIGLDELAEISLKADKAASITSQCSVFAESEVISLLNEGVPLPEIAAGINESIAARLSSLARKVGLREELTLTGGCAKNRGLVVALERRLGTRVQSLSADPQVIGALGAALIARERLLSKGRTE